MCSLRNDSCNSSDIGVVCWSLWSLRKFSCFSIWMIIDLILSNLSDSCIPILRNSPSDIYMVTNVYWYQQSLNFEKPYYVSFQQRHWITSRPISLCVTQPVNYCLHSSPYLKTRSYFWRNIFKFLPWLHGPDSPGIPEGNFLKRCGLVPA